VPPLNSLPALELAGDRDLVWAIVRRTAVAAAIVGFAVVLGASVHSSGKTELELVGAAAVLVVAIRRIEVAYVALALAGVILVGRLGVGDWTYLAAFTSGIVALRELARRRRPVLPTVLLLYGAWFLVASATNGSATGGRRHFLVNYLVPPLLALATAAAARDARVRRWIVAILLVAGLVEAGAVYFQAIAHGAAADTVTGTFGPSTANIIAVVLMLPATVFFAMAVERVWRPKLMLLLAFALPLCGVLSQGRAIFALVPVAFGAVGLSYGFSATRSRGARRALVAIFAVVVATPLLVVVYEGLFPTGLQGLTSLSGIESYLQQQNPGGALPQRGVQLKTALDLSTSGGPFTALAGRGVGATRLLAGGVANPATADETVGSLITATDSNDLAPFVTPEQATSGIWFGQILTETGWVGVLAFVALLADLIVLGRRTRERLPSGSLERALMVALPGLAWLALITSFYAPIFFEPEFNTFFWPLVGVCIAIAASVKRQQEPGSASRGRIIGIGLGYRRAE